MASRRSLIEVAPAGPAAWRSSPPCGGPRRGSAGWSPSADRARPRSRNSRAPAQWRPSGAGPFRRRALVENRAHSVALFAMYYNFVRVHKTLRTTPATAVRFQITERPLAQGKVNPLREQGEMTASRALGRPRFSGHRSLPKPFRAYSSRSQNAR